MKKSADELDDSMRVLKTAACPTLSGKSKLTYHIGVTPDSVIHLRIYGNSSSGAFSREWVSLDDVQAALKKRLEGQAITSYLLDPLFKGKSVNTPAFLLAVLAQEKLVRAMRGKMREHEILDPSGFIERVEKLIASGANVKVKEPVKTAGKTPIKKTVTKKPTVKKTVGKTAGKTVTKKAAVKKTVTKSTGAAKKKAAIKKRSVSRRKKVLTG